MKLNISLFLILLASALAYGQSPSKILKDAEKALGGQKALRTMRSSQATGTITRMSDGATGKFSITNSRPNLLHFSYDLAGFETEMGYNGRSAWTRDSRDGLRTLTGDASNDFQAYAAFRNALWLDYKRERSKIASGGMANLNGKSVNVVLLTTAKNVSIKLYFDLTTNLLFAEEFPFGEATRKTFYSGHRKIDGVMLPSEIVFETEGERLEVKLNDIKINQQIAASTFDFPKMSGEPLPDIAKLLTELQTNEDKVESLLDTYSYVQKQIKREVGKDGVVREAGSETYQLSFYKGNRIRRLVEKDGKPLNEKDQTKEDKEVQERVEEIEKRIAAKEAKGDSGPPSENSRRVSIAEVLRASRLVNPRRERFRGRDVIVFDFEPNPDFDYKNAKSMLKFFGKTAGAMWIDEKDKQVARLEAFLADNFNVGGGVLAKLRKNSSFVLEQERVNDEIWLPSVADINMSIRVLLLKGINVNQVVRSYDYKKFATEVKDAKVGDKPN